MNNYIKSFIRFMIYSTLYKWLNNYLSRYEIFRKLGKQPTGTLTIIIFLLGFMGTNLTNCSVPTLPPKTDKIPEKPDEISEAPKKDLSKIRSIALSPYRTPNKFSQSKKLLYRMYSKANHETTFYCGCSYTTDGKKRHDRDSCGLKLTKYVKLYGIDAEHVMPAYRIAKNLSCWKSGGRKNCDAMDKNYNLAATDLHNLRPAIPAINRLRSNYPFIDAIPGEKRDFGACDFEIENKLVEPPEQKKGDIARTYLYMNDIYDFINLTRGELEQFITWNKEDPADGWEQQRNKLIGEIQGNINPYIN